MENNKTLAGTKTEENLAIAFSQECEARTRYLFYATKAEKENFPTLKIVFEATADNERGHAETFFNYLSKSDNEKTLTPHVLVPIEMGSTLQNLKSAISTENLESLKLYPEFATIAEKEGFPVIAESFRRIATIEKWHHDRFISLCNRLNSNMLFDLTKETVWVCTNCGLHIRGKSAPNICPACHHPKYFYMTYYDEMFPVESSN